ncbi:MAG: GNAT family N-acetyltransferase [Bacteroidales bacterium]|nr:GNAT family N-acetyltransferase [Bacteroidales bacterium]
MDLRIYTLEELKPYLYTLYSNPESLVPVSPLRLESYLRNPRADFSDPVLFEMRQRGEVVAYRTLLPDYLYDREGQSQRFAWLSGNWVHPGFRRRGISTRLLETAEEQWQGRLMYTNFAPESRAVYDRSGRFGLISIRDGFRFHLRSATEDLLAPRMGYEKLFRTTDLLINRFREFGLQRFRFPGTNTCQVKQVNGFIAQLSELVSKQQRDTLFRRDREIFQWALEYPWLTEQGCDPINYHFSYRASRFENIIYHLIHSDGKSHGIIWLLIHNNALSVPYLFATEKGLQNCMAEVIVRTMIDKGCTHSTIRNAELREKMLAFKKIFLSVRKMPQLIFAHHKLTGLIPENPVIHDGDGDVMFTG